MSAVKRMTDPGGSPGARRATENAPGSAKLNGHDPRAHLKEVFERLPTL